MIKDERPRAVGIGRGEEGAQLAALDAAEQHGAFRADGVEHGPDVVHLRLERQGTRPVGEPHATLVEEDQAREGREPLEEAAHERMLPGVEDVSEEGGEDEIDRSVAEHLVGDRHVAAARVANLRDRRHDSRFSCKTKGAEVELAAFLPVEAFQHHCPFDLAISRRAAARGARNALGTRVASFW